MTRKVSGLRHLKVLLYATYSCDLRYIHPYYGVVGFAYSIFVLRLQHPQPMPRIPVTSPFEITKLRTVLDSRFSI